MTVVTDEETINDLLDRGVEEVIVKDHLEKRLKSGDVLRIKFGIDPTYPHMHLGHTVPLRKLRQFQAAGHQAILIIGDATAMVGDPTGRNETRKMLTRETIDENKRFYLEQAGRILDVKKLEVHHNGEWFFGMSATEFLGLTSLVTVQQVLQREDFQNRIDDSENPLSAIELTYPIMQGYDSVMIKADVEIGGHDQKLNLLMGRRLQRKFGQEEQDILTVPLLIGTDGSRKMSKSFGNAISLQDSAGDMYAKTMSIPDHLIVDYFTSLTNVPTDEIRAISQSLVQEEVNPRDAKARLAKEVVKLFYGVDEAGAASDRFDQLFKEHETPEDIPEHKIKSAMSIVDVMVDCGLAKSKSDARRLIEGGGVKMDGVVIENPEQLIEPSKSGVLIQKGKRHFVRVL